MSIKTIIANLLAFNIQTILFTALIAFFAYKLLKFYLQVFNLPPGPIPLPIIGNLLSLKRTKEHYNYGLEKIADKYGPMFTFWMGSTPIVFITDIDIGREVYNMNNFSGRPNNILQTLFTNAQGTHVAVCDYGERWKALRKVAHSAVLKYSKSEKLNHLVCDCVDFTIKTIIEKEGLNNPFAPIEYLYHAFLNIIATINFGQRYELYDPEYQLFNYVQKDLFLDLNINLILWEALPLSRKFDPKYKKTMNTIDKNYELLKSKFKSHYKDYDESIVRDFCDTLISAKNEALKEGRESAPHLTDENLTFVVFDLLFAGTSSSHCIFRWILFFMTYYPNVLKRLKKEIETEIGDRLPTHEDRERCHYAMAVISEVLRLRNPVYLGFNHKTVVDTKFHDYTFLEGTQIVVYQGQIMHSEKYWPNAHEFIPERFLEDEKYVKTLPKGFIPFSLGRRTCLGQTLAFANLFFILVRFIQKTSEYDLVLHYSGDIKPDPSNNLEMNTKDFKISFNTIN